MMKPELTKQDIHGSLSGNMSLDDKQAVFQNAMKYLWRVVDLRNARGLSLFFGFGQEKPFNFPSREQLVPRARRNALFFATNYALMAALVGVVTILMNPMFLIVLICVVGFWVYGAGATANESPENPTLIFGRPITPAQRKLGQAGISLAVIILFGGSVLFTICSSSVALAICHSVARDCPAVEEEEEASMLTGDIDNAVNNV